MIRCDICGNFVRERDAAQIAIHPGGVSKRWEIQNGPSKTLVTEESFDLCKACVINSLRKYYGEKFGEGVVDN